MNINIENKKGGFRKISEPVQKDQCRNKEHTPPMHIYLENGVYEYECPACGNKTIISVNKPTL